MRHPNLKIDTYVLKLNVDIIKNIKIYKNVRLIRKQSYVYVRKNLKT
jgi:hypothetical protein